MITFLINLSTEKINESTMKIYLYPYLKENKLRIIEGYTEYEDIINEVKYYIYNSDNIKAEKKEYQLLIILPIFNEKNKYFEKNLTNNIYEITEKLEERLLDEKIEPTEVNYLILDYLERDFRKKAININGGISEELNVDGYISSPIITYNDIKELEKIYKNILKENEDNELIWRKLLEELESFFREKKEKVLETKIGKIKDSSVVEHPKKYRIVARDLENNLKYEFNKGKIKEIDIENNMIEILKKNDYYYDFLFNVYDLNRLQFIWEKNDIVMKNEESFNLSEEFIAKIKKLRDELFEEIKEIIKLKKKALKNIIKDEKIENNCYLREKTLDELQKEFVNNYLEKYLGDIIENKSLKTQKIYTPLERMEFLLKKYYSLRKINSLQKNNIYRIPFIKDNTLKYNENLIKFIYFIMFLIEYGEKKETYIGFGKFLSLEDIKYRKVYLEELFAKYKNVLGNEEGNIDIKQKNLKIGNEINYYISSNSSYNKANNEGIISEKDTPQFSKFYEENDIKEYKKDWLDDLEIKFSNYIEQSNEALFDYQASKNRFVITSKRKKEIDKNIKDEVKERQEILEKARADLLKIEKEVKTEIKNEWISRNEKEISIFNLETLLDERPIKEDVFLTITLIVIFSTVFFFSSNNFISGQIALGLVAIFILTSFIVINFILTNHMNRIKQILNISKRERDSYINELREIFNVKKEYIDKQVFCRIAEKNFILVKKEEKKIEEKIELLGCYKEIIQNHCQITDNILNTLKSIKNDFINEKEYMNESFSNKLKDLNSKKAPFENDIFNLSKYIEIEEYKKFNIFFNEQENVFFPENIFGCESIKILEDEIYKKVEEQW